MAVHLERNSCRSLGLHRLLFGLIALACLTGAPLAAQEDGTPPRPELAVDPSPLLYEPKTPDEMFSAVLLMVDLARIDLAARYLNQFLDTSPDDEVLIRLRDKHGTAEFLRLTRIKALQAKAQTLLEQLSAASRKQSEDPAYAETLIAKLGRDPVQRETAIRELRNLGEGAVPHLLKHLANPSSTTEADQIIQALARIGLPAVAPTIAGLESPIPAVRQGTLAALSLLQSPSAIPYLWHAAYDPAQSPEGQQVARDTLTKLLKQVGGGSNLLTGDRAGLELQRIARGLYLRNFEPAIEDDGTVIVWGWDDEAGTVVRRSMTPERAQLWLATRFAKQALDVTPDNLETQRLFLGSRLGWAVQEQGRDQPLSLDPETPGYVALSAGEQTVTDVLADALAAGQTGTAQAALQILGQIGSHDMIIGGSGRKSPVIAALNYPDVRTQLLAANAILRLDPKQHFRGTDRIVSILGRALTNTNEAKALVVDADEVRGELTGGYVASLGYTPVLARTGKEAFQIAATTAGIELAVIQINCIQWDLSQTVANLRADARTAYLPIALYGPENIIDVQARSGRTNAIAFPEAASTIWNGTLPPGGRLEPLESTTRLRLGRLIMRSQPATFIAESGSATDFVDQLQPFIRRVGGGELSPEEREDFQAGAVRWLAHLAQADNSELFDLTPTELPLADLIENPQLAPLALVALAGIGSTDVQKRLLDVAIGSNQAASLRSAAANHLASHIQRHGILLTSDDLRGLIAAWKAEPDPVVATALAAVVGSLKPEPGLVSDRIGKLTAPR